MDAAREVAGECRTDARLLAMMASASRLYDKPVGVGGPVGRLPRRPEEGVVWPGVWSGLGLCTCDDGLPRAVPRTVSSPAWAGDSGRGEWFEDADTNVSFDEWELDDTGLRSRETWVGPSKDAVDARRAIVIVGRRPLGACSEP